MPKSCNTSQQLKDKKRTIKYKQKVKKGNIINENRVDLKIPAMMIMMVMKIL